MLAYPFVAAILSPQRFRAKTQTHTLYTFLHIFAYEDCACYCFRMFFRHISRSLFPLSKFMQNIECFYIDLLFAITWNIFKINISVSHLRIILHKSRWFMCEKHAYTRMCVRQHVNSTTALDILLFGFILVQILLFFLQLHIHILYKCVQQLTAALLF